MGNSIHFWHTNGCSCESVKVFETENVSTWEGLEPPTFRFMSNALVYHAIQVMIFGQKDILIDWLIDLSIACLIELNMIFDTESMYTTHTHTLTNLCRKRLQISSHNNPKPYHWNKAPCFSNMSARWKSKISTDEIPFSINPQESQTKWPNAI